MRHEYAELAGGVQALREQTAELSGLRLKEESLQTELAQTNAKCFELEGKASLAEGQLRTMCHEHYQVCVAFEVLREMHHQAIVSFAKLDGRLQQRVAQAIVRRWRSDGG